MKKSDRILEKKMGSITFVVDRDLTAPNGHLEDPRKGQTVAEYILKKQSMSDEAPEIFAMSCPEATLYGHGQDVFFPFFLIFLDRWGRQGYNNRKYKGRGNVPFAPTMTNGKRGYELWQIC